jgi:hypothetical protein
MGEKIMERLLEGLGETADFLTSGESCILFSASVHAGFSEGSGREGKAKQSYIC